MHEDSTSLSSHPSLLTRELMEVAVQPLFWAQLRFQLLGSVLCGTLRESDIVAYAVEVQEFVAILPECDGAAARRALARLHELYARRLGIGVRAGLAVYPADALSLEDLLERARRIVAHVTTDHHLMIDNKGITGNGATGTSHGNGAAHA